MLPAKSGKDRGVPPTPPDKREKAAPHNCYGVPHVANARK